jgi:SAM-dependent methyltransferase
VSDSSERADPWASGTAYEAYVGRWSALVAPEFLRSLAVEPGRRWLDVGCGTGILTRAILDGAGPASVVGVDPSEPFLDHARAAIPDPRARFVPGTAAATGLEGDEADVVVLCLVLNQVPDVAAALAEAVRVAVPGGVIAAYVWDYAGGMEFIRAFWDAAVALDPAAAVHDQAKRFPIAAPGPLEGAFAAAGLEAVEVRAIEIPTTFADFDDLWTPFTRGTGDAPVYLAGLDPNRREAVRERLRASVPVEADGSIHLSARAWAAIGRVPR